MPPDTIPPGGIAGGGAKASGWVAPPAGAPNGSVRFGCPKSVINSAGLNPGGGAACRKSSGPACPYPGACIPPNGSAAAGGTGAAFIPPDGCIPCWSIPPPNGSG
ncbi:MAG TPA: hypothetical protein VHB27_14580, partial [Rhodopila sp.]|uniref:hypothetical protein n=1 Tax=Rhodopila sp. TaxID=2480087 RepID=UPI002BE153B7